MSEATLEHLVVKDAIDKCKLALSSAGIRDEDIAVFVVSSAYSGGIKAKECGVNCYSQSTLDEILSVLRQVVRARADIFIEEMVGVNDK